MFETKSSTIDNGYVSIIEHLLNTKSSDVIEQTRRGDLLMREDYGIFVLTNPRARVVLNRARRLSPFFLAGEFLWIFSGLDELKYVLPFNSRMADYSDDHVSLYGAYGKRLGSQLEIATNLLISDPFTRQALIHIGNPNDSGIKTKDYPCNQLLQFTVRKPNLLDLTVFVRSQDMLLGFPYDVFHWTMVQEVVANCSGLQLGEYRHFMSNCHVYMKDASRLMNIVSSQDHPNLAMSPLTINNNKTNSIKVLQGSTRHNFAGLVDGNLLQNSESFGSLFSICSSKLSGLNPVIEDPALHKLYTGWVSVQHS